MEDSSSVWVIDPTSQFHFHEWSDGVALYLEGEGGTYLLDPFAAKLLQWLNVAQQSTDAIARRLLNEYPDDTLENIIDIVDSVLDELRTRGFVIKTGEEL